MDSLIDRVFCNLENLPAPEDWADKVWCLYEDDLKEIIRQSILSYLKTCQDAIARPDQLIDGEEPQ